MNGVATAERLWPEGRSLGAAYPATRWSQVPLPDPDRWAPGIVRAHISWGRWVVGCPWCGSAQVAWEEDRRFLCVECGNLGKGWLKVVWPVNYEAIVAVLSLRPIAATRNWNVGEALDMLRAENVAHGVDPGRPDPADMQRALRLFRGPE